MAEGGRGTKSPKYRAFRACFDRLVSGVHNNTAAVARKAFSNNLISERNNHEAHNDLMSTDDRANNILGIILNKVKDNDCHFDTFVAILKEDPTTEDVAAELESKAEQFAQEDTPSSHNHLNGGDRNSPDNLPGNKKNPGASNLDYSDSGLASAASILRISTPPPERQEIAGLSSAINTTAGRSSILSGMPKLDLHIGGNSSSSTLTTPHRLQRTLSAPSTSTPTASNVEDKFLKPSSETEMPSGNETNLVSHEMMEATNSAVQESDSGGSQHGACVFPERQSVPGKDARQVMADTRKKMSEMVETVEKELQQKEAENVELQQQVCQLNAEKSQLDARLKETQSRLEAKEKEVVEIKQEKDAEICDLKVKIQKLEGKVAGIEKQKDDLMKTHQTELEKQKEKCEELKDLLSQVTSQKEEAEQNLRDANQELALKNAEKRAEVAEKQAEILTIKLQVGELQCQLYEKNNQLDLKKHELLQKDNELRIKEKELAEEKLKNCAKENEKLKKQNLEERRRSKQLEKKVVALETQISQNSQNSSVTSQTSAGLQSQYSHASQSSMSSQMSQNSLDSIDEDETKGDDDNTG